jgi:hypothetical protein
MLFSLIIVEFAREMRHQLAQQRCLKHRVSRHVWWQDVARTNIKFTAGFVVSIHQICCFRTNLWFPFPNLSEKLF